MGELSVGWPKVARRFLAEALYGIQARQLGREDLESENLDIRRAIHKVSKATEKKASDSCCHSWIWEDSDDAFNRPANDQEPEKHMVGGQILSDKVAH